VVNIIYCEMITKATQ